MIVKNMTKLYLTFWSYPLNTYSQLKKYAFGLLSSFGLPHYFELVFSNMN